MNRINHPERIFNDRAAAEKAAEGLDPSEYRIDCDPKGSGRCKVMMLDEETGEEMGYF